MRHHKAFRNLGRTSGHRKALLRNLATSLVLHNQIETTLPKAKELRRVADKLVTLGKKGTLHARRQAMEVLFAVHRTEAGNKEKLSAVHRLFTEIAPRYSERNGGYTRVIRTRKRDGDNAQMAIIQFVEAELAVKEQTPRRRRRAVKKSADAAAPAADVAQNDQASENDSE